MRLVPLAVAAAVATALAASVLDPYLRFLAAQLAVTVIAVIGLNLLGHVAGMLSLASAAFMGVGGYALLVLLTLSGCPLGLAVPLTLVLGWAVGWCLGLVAVRLSGISLAIVTFGFVQIFQVFAKQGGALSGDGYGLVVPPIELAGLGPLTPDLVAYGCIAAAVAVAIFTTALTRSRVGRAWFAIKDHPVAAEMQGIPVARTRASAFAVSGALATLAGILQALLLGITNPNLYTVDVSISHLAMMVVGGSSGGVAGAILGPALLFFVPEYLNLGEYREVMYGLALLATLILAPRGLAGLWRVAWRRVPGRWRVAPPVRPAG